MIMSKPKSPIYQEMEKSIFEYLKKHEFFWLHVLKSELGVSQPMIYSSTNPDSIKYAVFDKIIQRLKKDNLIQCTEVKGCNKQFYSTLYA